MNNRTRNRPSVAYSLSAAHADYVRQLAKTNDSSASFVVGRMIHFFMSNPANLSSIQILNTSDMEAEAEHVA